MMLKVLLTVPQYGEHFDAVADFNQAKRGSGIQVDLQKARARFLRGETNIPPGNARTFNPASLD